MPVSPELLKQLLRKQKEKTITEREMVLLRLYLSTSGAEEALEAVDFSDMPEANDQPGSSSETRYQHILDRTGQLPERRFQWRRWAAGVAAAVVGIAGIALLFQYTAKESSQLVAAALITYQTGNGEIREIVLPDSSHVWLNARSVLSHPETFGGKERKVLLQQGQAFFEITHDTRRPFIVESQQGIHTRVLGTSFGITTDCSAATVQVAVKTGKVRVDREKETVATLLPGEQVDYDITRSSAQLSRVNPAGISRWTGGEVKLVQADFAAMAATMQQLYGIKIMPGSTAVSRNLYSLTIRYGADAHKLVEVISGVNGNRYEWKNADSTLVVIH